MNTRKGKEKFQNFQILLDSGCNSMIVTKRLIEKLGPEKDSMIEWQLQAGNITPNFKVQVDFTLPAFSATNVPEWKFHVDDSARCRYDLILVRDILT